MRRLDRLVCAALIVGCGLILATRADAAPDDSWDAGFHANGTEPIDGVVNAIVASGGNVYVGGHFSTIFGVRANNIARWDGSTWSALGSGVSGYTNEVYALAVSGSDVYVGGGFTTAGGVSASSIAKWNGTSWSALGSGVGSARVLALAVLGSTVYAGGEFTTAGGSSANHIAQWNGTTWSALGTGMNDNVRALAVSGSTLYAGGDFTSAGGSTANRIAQWNGTSWSALGTGTDNRVQALTVNGSDLYAGGSFTSAGGVSGTSYIARWNGTTWSTLGSGMNSTVLGLAVAGGDLYAVGPFSSAGGTAVQSIARWNGASWSSLAGGGPGFWNPIGTLAGSGTDLYVGGQFIGAGGTAATSIARWNGSAWSLVTTTPGAGMAAAAFYPGVRVLAYSGSGDLYAGGVFEFAGSTPAISIAKFNGTAWSALGSGLEGTTDANHFHGHAEALAFYGGDLMVGGNFTTAGGVTVNHIARWNGTTFAALGSGMSFGAHVNALAVYNGELYAGGGFSSAGGTSASNIARWNGTSWSAVGSGTSGPVYALAVVGSDLYVGGSFGTAGGGSAGNIARWNGTTWSAVGSGRDGTVNALGVIGSDLYAGGSFSDAVAKWDGSTWSTVGGGVCTYCGFGGHYVATLATVGNDVYIGGPFDFVGPGNSVVASNIAKWNGVSWSALGSGIGGTPLAFAVAGSDVYVGGRISIAGNRGSSHIALWHTCGNGLLDSGEQCDDGNLVNGDCCSSTCQFEAPSNPCPDDGNPCTNDLCNASGTCTHPNNTLPCNDNLFCNGADTCSGGGCNTHAGNPCAGGSECAHTCNETADNCFDPPTTACTSDGNVCTDDHCNGAGACVYTNNTVSCNNSLFCDGTDVCAGGICTHSGNPCTGGPECAHTCNETAANCFDLSTTACTSDGNLCTDDHCNGAGACVNTNNSVPCDDGNGCTVNDTCSGGSCVGNSNICGDGVVEASCGEQCDDGGTIPGGGCDASCQLDILGRACKRAVGLQARKLAVKDLVLQQKCLDRVATGKLACQGSQCVVNPASAMPITVSGSSCTVAADCCPDFDNATSTSTSRAKIGRAEVSAANAIKKACSLANGGDGMKGTDDDTFIDPQIFGFGATCLDVVGACGSIATTALLSPGADNDLIECSACAAETVAMEVLGFHYPLAGSGAPAVTCQRAVGLQARQLAVYELTKRQKCLDKVANNKLACQAAQCVLNPTAAVPVTVPSSSCTVGADCCPGFDNADATKSTQAKLTTYAGKVATAIKKGCSTANGVDGMKGTDDDSFVDPQSLGYGSSCLAVLGQCGTIATNDTVVAGAGNDLVECVACTQQTVGSGLTSFHAPPAQ